MSASRIQSRGASAFVRNVTEFLEFIAEKYPNCQSTKDMLLLFRNVVSNDESRRKNFIDAWCKNMSSPLVRVKYSKALERCLDGRDKPCLVHAVSYKDIHAFETSCTAQIMDDLDLVEKYRGIQDNLSDDEKALFWKLMSDITENAFEASGQTLPRVPPRDELARHVKAKKTTQDASNAVQKAFLIALRTLLDSRNATGVTVDERDGHEWCRRWVEFSKDRDTSGREAHDLIAGSEQCAELLRKHFAEVDWSAPLTSTEFGLISQIVSMSRVETAVPANMMNQIEGIAGKLADDIMSGDKDLSNLNIEAIASEIQGKFTESDMQSLTSSMDMLMPALGALSGMGGAIGPGTSAPRD